MSHRRCLCICNFQSIGCRKCAWRPRAEEWNRNNRNHDELYTRALAPTENTARRTPPNLSLCSLHFAVVLSGQFFDFVTLILTSAKTEKFGCMFDGGTQTPDGKRATVICSTNAANTNRRWIDVRKGKVQCPHYRPIPTDRQM